MKLFKYLFLLLIIVIISIIGFYFYQAKTQEKGGLISPVTTIDYSPSGKPVIFSLENAPSETLRGEISNMTGKISWQSRTATQAAEISAVQTIQQGEKLITQENSTLTLGFDGACRLVLGADTEIAIIQTLPDNIVFEQIKGTVEYNKTGNYPISIRSGNLLAENNGNITVSIDPEKPIIKLKLTSGQAALAYNDLDYLSHKQTIKANQTFTFNDDTRTGVVK